MLVPGQHEQPRPARAYWLTDAAVSAAAGRHGADRSKLDPASAEVAEKSSESLQAPHETAGEPRAISAADADEVLLALLRAAPRGPDSR